jgi:hypothetical protein
MTSHIPAILVLKPALDASYERVKAETWEWAKTSTRGNVQTAPE